MLYVSLKALHKQFGQEYVVVVPSTVYGPDYYTWKQLHFIFDLIQKFWHISTAKNLLFCGVMGIKKGVDLY